MKNEINKAKPKRLEEANRYLYNGFEYIHVSSLLAANGQDIVPIDSLPKSKEEYMTVEAAVDSAAGETVGPTGVFKMFPLKPSAGSIAGRQYISATKHRTPNLGERRVKFETDEGEMTNMVIQEAGIGNIMSSQLINLRKIATRSTLRRKIPT